MDEIHDGMLAKGFTCLCHTCGQVLKCSCDLESASSAHCVERASVVSTSLAYWVDVVVMMFAINLFFNFSTENLLTRLQVKVFKQHGQCILQFSGK